jgi:hypothetical protein
VLIRGSLRTSELVERKDSEGKEGKGRNEGRTQSHSSPTSPAWLNLRESSPTPHRIPSNSPQVVPARCGGENTPFVHDSTSLPNLALTASEQGETSRIE